ncbi:hypothetical protein RB195_020621 [Necator americanus]|uniref:Uncharacterized protein n=1 Tax=Necator americanus TaxID=51031 RepID=A0ABR1CJN9_NECAM
MAKNIDSLNNSTESDVCGEKMWQHQLDYLAVYAQHQATKKKKSKLSIGPGEVLPRRSCLLQGHTGDFNAKVDPRRTPEELHIGTHGLQWNDQGERLSSSS